MIGEGSICSRGGIKGATMFPLSHMLKSFVRIGTLKVIDADGQSHDFVGAPGPKVTMRLTDRSLYYKLFLNPELHAGEAYMDGRMRFEDSTLTDFLTLFSINRLSLGSYPLQKFLRTVSRGLRRFQQANPTGKAQKNVAKHCSSPLISRMGARNWCAIDREIERRGAASLCVQMLTLQRDFLRAAVLFVETRPTD